MITANLSPPDKLLDDLESGSCVYDFQVEGEREAVLCDYIRQATQKVVSSVDISYTNFASKIALKSAILLDHATSGKIWVPASYEKRIKNANLDPIPQGKVEVTIRWQNGVETKENISESQVQKLKAFLDKTKERD